jgi:hypothetical protein
MGHGGFAVTSFDDYRAKLRRDHVFRVVRPHGQRGKRRAEAGALRMASLSGAAGLHREG